MSTTTKKKPTILNRIVGRLPPSAKRMLFGAVLFQLCLHGQTNQAQLGQLNKELSLSSSVEALVFPSLWSDTFWGEDKAAVQKIEALMKGKATDDPTFWTEVIGAVPDWLRYASDDLMLNDIRRLVEVIGRCAK